ncbi:hypothetical protein [Nitrospira lenta]|uniref:DUF4440 domain-containing protein n=1 Tax=Nitrospira lenta TaxID=1436998 RepID=A0A330L5B4_9BACT|nr:hypothetical protein [Nitrospira lenta]SPP65011.1 conserved hypothetical protein [Nitrospira lenta]
MDTNLPVSPFYLRMLRWCGVAVLLTAVACSSKTLQYPEDHERFIHIDRAVEALREAYQHRDRSAFQDVMLPAESLEQIQAEAAQDFELFQSIQLDFKTERIMIDGENIDVYVHWQGVWKKNPDDAGIRQRGHARLQWIGKQSILLRGVQGDLPFGMKVRQALSDLPAAPQKSLPQ